MAVYTRLSSKDIEGFLELYEAVTPLSSFSAIAAGVTNSNYLLNCGETRYILTIFEQESDAKNLPFFLSFMQHLATKNLPIPQIPLQRTGNLYCGLHQKPACLTSFLEGNSIEEPEARHCAELGKALAAFHLAGADFTETRKNDLSPPDWQIIYENNATRAHEIAPDLPRLIEEKLYEIMLNWPHDLPRGIIHGDLFPDNVFFEDNKISGLKISGLFDFYYACTDFYAYDLAICINAWCFSTDGSQFYPIHAASLIRAYTKIRPLSEAEKSALPLLLQGAALCFLLTRLNDILNHDPDDFVSFKSPLDYAARLRYFSENDPETYL